MAQDDFMVNDPDAARQQKEAEAAARHEMERATALLGSREWEWFIQRVATPMLEEAQRQVMEADLTPGQEATEIIKARERHKAMAELIARPQQILTAAQFVPPASTEA